MYTILLIVQIIISVFLILAICSQQRGTGLSATFGGTGGFHSSKRGAEKFLSTATTVLAVLFIVNSIAFIFI
ncbi:preprotein translocase subunit SecG [Patescibacteria group bacterium]